MRGENLFGKDQRKVTDKYREGWDRTFGKKDTTESVGDTDESHTKKA